MRFPFLITMSPAKRFCNFTNLPTTAFTIPTFLHQADQLALKLKQLSAMQLAEMMKISPELAALNHTRYQDYDSTNANKLYPAASLFAGDAFCALDFTSMSATELATAQQHLRILSGLYGILRPLDTIQRYRLEMGCSTKPYLGQSLYHIWRLNLSKYLNKSIIKNKYLYHLNLASLEYAKALVPSQISIPTITFIFARPSANTYKGVGIEGKRARGAMVRFLLTQKPASLIDLQTYSNSYAFSTEHSTTTKYVFLKTR